jgi:hypothetical protein
MINATALMIKQRGFNPDNGPECPYCHRHSTLQPASVVYKNSTHTPTGNVWVCMNYPTCDSFVGTHKEEPFKDYPLGRLANPELRTARKAVHAVFDLMFKHRHMTRSETYKWLQKELSMTPEECHIGEMDIMKCNLVYVKVLQYFHETYENLNNQSSSANLSWL